MPADFANLAVLHARIRPVLRAAWSTCLALTIAGCTQLSFGPRVLHETQALFGTLAVTEEFDGTRALRFGRSGATQTVIIPGQPDVLHFVYARLLLAGLPARRE